MVNYRGGSSLLASTIDLWARGVMAATRDLGSRAKAWGFKSLRAYHLWGYGEIGFITGRYGRPVPSSNLGSPAIFNGD